VYVWADGVYLKARMEPQAECMLVLIGATPEGKKELLGFQVGVRESAQSWRELLVDLKTRGLVVAPELATGDGALGFWKALAEVSPTTRHQRCTLHKTVNVLDKLPKSVQPAAKSDLREVWNAPDRATAEAAIATFAEKYGAKYEKAVTCLTSMLEQGRAMPIVDAIVRLGSTLHLDIVAEGVETDEQLRMLRSMCCGQVQGYLLGRPVPATNVVGILDEDCARAGLAVLAWTGEAV
jgi:transposase-like protein